VSEFQAVIRADHHSLPYYLEYAEVFLAAMKQINGRDCPPGLIGKQIGEWIRNQQLVSYRIVLVESGFSDKSC
jgi:tRNA nucleotidyltransferase (CCA-adding enzyme)